MKCAPVHGSTIEQRTDGSCLEAALTKPTSSMCVRFEGRSKNYGGMSPIIALSVRTALGEGLHWDAKRSLLWLVDISGQRIIAWDTLGPDWKQWEVAERIGWIIPERNSDTFLLGLKTGIARVGLRDAEGGPVGQSWLARPFFDPALRLNDAKADAFGAVWAGSMNDDDEDRIDGSLFRLDPNGTVRRMDQGYKVANGPAISPDGRWMLHADSPRQLIYRFDISDDGANISGKQIWKKFEMREGYPDGMTFDAEGCVWVAHWAGSCVSRFDAQGKLLRRVSLPVSRVTNICFGGKLLDRLFVTTAMPDQQVGELDGALFEIDPQGVRGLPGRGYGTAGV